jgi:hypothetical protein
MEIVEDKINLNPSLHSTFSTMLRARLALSAEDPNVAGFKSVVCYRTGLDVSTDSNLRAEEWALHHACNRIVSTPNVSLRLADKPSNDLVVRVTLEVAAKHNKPGMVHSTFSWTIPYDSPFLMLLPTLQYSFTRALAMRISRLPARAQPTYNR